MTDPVITTALHSRPIKKGNTANNTPNYPKYSKNTTVRSQYYSKHFQSGPPNNTNSIRNYSIKLRPYIYSLKTTTYNSPTRSANDNSARWRATQSRSAADDLPSLKSTPVEHPHIFTSSLLPQPPISTANQNSRIPSRQDHSEIWGHYKPAQTDPRQDLTATHTRDNISGFGLSSPAPQQPPTKPFSGLPARHSMTDSYREARDVEGERPGIIYRLQPCAARPDTRLQIDAALPEAATLDRRTRPPTVLDIAESQLPENHQPQGPRLPKRQSRKATPQSLDGGLQTV